MTKQLLFNDEARQKVLEGINVVANAVKVTLGPKGRNVILDQEYGDPHITKDGVSVAKEIELSDKYQNVGVKLIKSVANKTVQDVGDATTTSTLLTQAIVSEGLKNVTAGANPTDLKNGIDKAVKAVVEIIKETAIPVGDKVGDVATISANNDEEIGYLIASAVKRVGPEGIITIEEAKGTETYIQVNEGIQFNTGFLSPYFITDRDKSTCVLENPKVLLYDGKIDNLKDFYPVLERVMTNKESVLIIANDYDSEVLDTLILNKIKAGFKVCVVKTPRLHKDEILNDISNVTDAFILDDRFKPEFGHLGYAEKIIVDKHNTTIINGKASNLEHHIKDLKNRGEEERAAKLEGGIATLYVGGNSEVELKEKKDRIEDALCATKAAIEEGIVPGGGTVYIKAYNELANMYPFVNPDVKTGINIIRQAILLPLKQICLNAGISGDVIINKILEKNEDNFGYDAKYNRFDNLIELGIIDPAKAVRVALENAASVGGLFLTTECVIVDE